MTPPPIPAEVVDALDAYTRFVRSTQNSHDYGESTEIGLASEREARAALLSAIQEAIAESPGREAIREAYNAGLCGDPMPEWHSAVAPPAPEKVDG